MTMWGMARCCRWKIIFLVENKMGLLILSEYKLDNGLSATNLYVTIKGSYQFVKCTPMMSETIPYRVFFQIVMYINEQYPLQQTSDWIDVESLVDFDPFQRIYDHIKTRFPAGTQIQDVL